MNAAGRVRSATMNAATRLLVAAVVNVVHNPYNIYIYKQTELSADAVIDASFILPHLGAVHDLSDLSTTSDHSALFPLPLREVVQDVCFVGQMQPRNRVFLERMPTTSTQVTHPATCELQQQITQNRE